MKIKLLVGDVLFKEFDVPDDAPLSQSLAMTLNHDDGRVIMMRFRHIGTEKNEYSMVLESAFSPADEHITALETIVKASRGEE